MAVVNGISALTRPLQVGKRRPDGAREAGAPRATRVGAEVGAKTGGSLADTASDVAGMAKEAGARVGVGVGKAMEIAERVKASNIRKIGEEVTGKAGRRDEPPNQMMVVVVVEGTRTMILAIGALSRAPRKWTAIDMAGATTTASGLAFRRRNIRGTNRGTCRSTRVISGHAIRHHGRGLHARACHSTDHHHDATARDKISRREARAAA